MHALLTPPNRDQANQSMAATGYIIAAVVGFAIALGLGLVLLALAPLVVELVTRRRYPVAKPGGAVLITGSSTGMWVAVVVWGREDPSFE